MRIVFDDSLLTGRHLPGAGSILWQLIMEMAKRHPDDSFTILSLHHSSKIPDLPFNVKAHHIKTGYWQWLPFTWWRKRGLPGELNRLKGELYVTSGDKPGNLSIPTCHFMMQSGVAVKLPVLHAKKNPIKPRILKALKAAACIVTFSGAEKNFLQQVLPEAGDKVRLLLPGIIDDARPLKWVDKENIKIKYSGGREYFVFAGDIEDGSHLYALLRAFSRFKKWQLSNMQLVLIGNKTATAIRFFKKLDSFKYKADVHIIAETSKEILLEIIASAYAFICPGSQDYLLMNILRAIHSGVPVIAPPPGTGEPAAAYGIMYATGDSEACLADSMRIIYKDENLRAGIISEAQYQISSGENYDMVEECRQVFKAVLQTNHSNFAII